MNRSGALRLCCLLLATSALGGCVAAALPVLATGAIGSRAVSDDDKGEAVPANAVITPAPSVVAGAAEPLPGAVNLTEAYVGAALFAVERAETGLSVLPDPTGDTGDALVRACSGQPPAVLVDLDPGDVAFRPGQDAQVATPGMANALALARSRGLAVLWISVLDESREQEVRTALASSGLDPAANDPILLTRDPAETKTRRRDVAADEWCIAAIIGDRKGDFDDLMNYLRDPDAPTPFDPLIGNGWFELPPPFLSEAA